MSTTTAFREYRRAARRVVPDITLIEARYCWFACISLAWIEMKVLQLRLEEKRELEYKRSLKPDPIKRKPKTTAKGPRRRPEPKWFRAPKAPRQVRLQNPDEMHGKARALLAKLFPK